MKRIPLAAAFAVLIPLVPSALASETRITLAAVGALSSSLSSVSASGVQTSVAGNPRMGWGGSLGWEELWTDRVSTELGLTFYSRSQEVAGSPWLQPVLQLPVLARFHFWDWLSLGLGGYGAVAFWTPTAATADSVSRRNWDLGLSASLRAAWSVSRRWGLFVDSRFHLGLINQEGTPNVRETWREGQVLTGLRVSL